MGSCFAALESIGTKTKKIKKMDMGNIFGMRRSFIVDILKIIYLNVNQIVIYKVVILKVMEESK